jgi:hypothetical protein
VLLGGREPKLVGFFVRCDKAALTSERRRSGGKQWINKAYHAGWGMKAKQDLRFTNLTI